MFTGYDRLFSAEREGGALTEVACWAHARRKIHDVYISSKSTTAEEALKRISELYAIEDEIRGLPESERLAVRQQRSKELLTSLHEWMVEKNGTLSKKSRLGETFSYVLNQWDALCYYSDDGLAEADNNTAERALRAVCLGKKNYMFFGNGHGGERGALLYGLIGSCRLNGVDPESYLRHILCVLPEWPSNRVDELLPWNVAPINKCQYGALLTLTSDDTDVLLRIHHVIGELPTYGYRRVWALLRRQAELDGMPAINAKRVYRIMRQNVLLLERKPAVPPSKRAHTGKVAVKESNQRWCSDGFEFRCDNGEKLRVTFALDCCDREALHCAITTGGFDSETVQKVMLGAVERRFGNELPASPVEWLTDNGSCYRANETRQFARMLGLEPKNTAVRSPESNGIAESFVKTIKRDYISVMPKPDGLTAAKNLAEAFEHYNEWHPHSALGYRSLREYLRQQASNGLSDNRCLEI